MKKETTQTTIIIPSRVDWQHNHCSTAADELLLTLKGERSCL